MATAFKQLQPLDEHNEALESSVHPRDWVNPNPPERPYHLIVIGAGTAGLVTAAGAAGLGARVALIERELMGGDCLNVGCVPSKAVLRAARVAATVRDSVPYGVNASDVTFDFGRAMERMRRLRAKISPADSAQRFQGLGIDVYLGQGAFESQGTIRVSASDGSERRLKYRKAVIATGARAAAPPIPGLSQVSYLTNETLFSLTERPERLGILGSGPIGSEMAQAFARFGTQVFLFERQAHILTREDPEAAEVVQRQLVRDGVQLVLGAQDLSVRSVPEDRISVRWLEAGKPQETDVDHLLVAVGRAPNLEGLDLDQVDVRADRSGVVVNDFLQTSNPKIYAAGDVASRYQFTHAADFQARIVIQNALFALGPFGRKRASRLLVPWATYTSPEIAHVGMYSREAEEKGIEIDTYVQSLEHVDRAILEGQDEGFVKVHTKRGTDEIVGATIVAENAGDLISEITVAMNNKIGLAKIGASIHPYPTQAEAIRKLGDQFNRTKLTPTSQRVLGFLRRINVGS